MGPKLRWLGWVAASRLLTTFLMLFFDALLSDHDADAERPHSCSAGAAHVDQVPGTSFFLCKAIQEVFVLHCKEVAFMNSQVIRLLLIAGGLGSFMRERLEGLIVWDSVYFVGIAKCGYEGDKAHAFFPMLPLSMKLLQGTGTTFNLQLCAGVILS